MDAVSHSRKKQNVKNVEIMKLKFLDEENLPKMLYSALAVGTFAVL